MTVTAVTTGGWATLSDGEGSADNMNAMQKDVTFRAAVVVHTCHPVTDG